MADIHGQIKTRLRNIVGTGSGISAVFTAQVTAVNSNTCEVLVDDNTMLTDVRLLAVINSETSNMLVTPKVGSYVLITDLSGGKLNDLAVLQFSEIEKITINGGELGGLVKIKELTEKLNALENDLNALKQVFSTWVPVTQDGGAALRTAATTWYGQSITVTTQQEIEDDKITH
jgi:hypothetical protein